MPYRPTPWAHLVRAEPSTARSRILAAFLATDGNATHAARMLNVSHRTLCRYVKVLALADDIRRIRDG